jgi:hypothetical protein
VSASPRLALFTLGSFDIGPEPAVPKVAQEYMKRTYIPMETSAPSGSTGFVPSTPPSAPAPTKVQVLRDAICDILAIGVCLAVCLVLEGTKPVSRTRHAHGAAAIAFAGCQQGWDAGDVAASSSTSSFHRHPHPLLLLIPAAARIFSQAEAV